MSSIGAVSFDIMRGLPQSLRTRTEAWETPGISGVGALRLGEGDAEFELVCVKYAVDNAAALVHAGYVDNLQGTVVTVTDDNGDAYLSVLVRQAQSTKRPCIWNGNADARRVESHFRLVST